MIPDDFGLLHGSQSDQIILVDFRRVDSVIHLFLTQFESVLCNLHSISFFIFERDFFKDYRYNILYGKFNSKQIHEKNRQRLEKKLKRYVMK